MPKPSWPLESEAECGGGGGGGEVWWRCSSLGEAGSSKGEMTLASLWAILPLRLPPASAMPPSL